MEDNINELKLYIMKSVNMLQQSIISLCDKLHIDKNSQLYNMLSDKESFIIVFLMGFISILYFFYFISRLRSRTYPVIADDDYHYYEVQMAYETELKRKARKEKRKENLHKLWKFLNNKNKL
ncbi:MAG: hypothetical protein BWY74_00068 [Firmicutes bacterium ADurb.Bin419]|nr:MAG: hypothetical protein BWY74_00068 [Firmicutes bacterium ADurb.Bin419]